MTKKDLIQAVNLVAKANFEVAQMMLNGLNEHWGTAYGWLNKRVVIFDNPHAGVAAEYARGHDADRHIDD